MPINDPDAKPARTRRSKRDAARDTGAPTVRDVAKVAGVSTASVSRTLSLPDAVSVDVRERVSLAVATLGYVRNTAGRALASRRTGVVGVVVPCLADGLHECILAALEERLRPAGYLVALVVAGPDDALEQARRLLSLGVEGIVSIGNAEVAEIRAVAERRRVPWVDVAADRPASARDCVGLDFERAGMTVAQYLHGLGHRRFALLAGARRNEAPLLWGERGRTLQKALTGLAGASVVESQLTGLSVDAAADLTSRLMRQPSPPTAIVCTHDWLAAGAVKGCEYAGAVVPADASITGFGDAEWSRHAKPALTTLRLPAADAGHAAAARVLARLENRTGDIPALLARLIVRASSGPPPGR